MLSLSGIAEKSTIHESHQPSYNPNHMLIYSSGLASNGCQWLEMSCCHGYDACDDQ